MQRSIHHRHLVRRLQNNVGRSRQELVPNSQSSRSSSSSCTLSLIHSRNTHAQCFSSISPGLTSSISQTPTPPMNTPSPSPIHSRNEPTKELKIISNSSPSHNKIQMKQQQQQKEEELKSHDANSHQISTSISNGVADGTSQAIATNEEMLELMSDLLSNKTPFSQESIQSSIKTINHWIQKYERLSSSSKPMNSIKSAQEPPYEGILLSCQLILQLIKKRHEQILLLGKQWENINTIPDEGAGESSIPTDTIYFDLKKTLHPILNMGRKCELHRIDSTFSVLAQELLESLERLYLLELSYQEHTGFHSKNQPQQSLENRSMIPTIKTYNMVLDILSKSSLEDAPLHITSILQRMEQHDENDTLHQEPHQSIPQTQSKTQSMTTTTFPPYPDSISYNTLLYAYSQSQDNKAPFKCEGVLRQIQARRPDLIDTISYNIVLHTWAENSALNANAPHRASELLQEMEEIHESRIGTPIQDLVKPNAISYTTVINSWGKSNQSKSCLDSAQNAEALLIKMMERYQKYNDSSLKPNTITMNVALNAWAKSSHPESAHRSQRLLYQMMDWSFDGERNKFEKNIQIRPDAISFTICINAWADCREKGGSRKKTSASSSMSSSMSSSSLKASTWTELADSPSDNALKLLKEMKYLAKEYKISTQPDTVTMNSVLRAIGNDDTHPSSKATKAESILLQMERMNIPIERQTYNNTLRCCSTTRSNDIKIKRDVIRIAVNILLQMKKKQQHSQHAPDPYTFNFFIKTVDRSCTDSAQKLKLFKAAFTFCIECGQLSHVVLNLLRNVLSPNDLRNLLQSSMSNNKKDVQIDVRNLNLNNLPIEWRCGVHQKRKGRGGQRLQSTTGGIQDSLRSKKNVGKRYRRGINKKPP